MVTLFASLVSFLVQTQLFNSFLKIETAKNQEDVQEALELSLKAFYPQVMPPNSRAMWRIRWLNEPGFNPKYIYIIRDGSKIIGGLRTVARRLYRGDESFSMLGLAEIFIHPNWQGKKVTLPLISHVLRKATQEGFDLAGCIARRNIDYFYTRYGLWGLGSYQQISLKNRPYKPETDNSKETPDLELKPVKKRDLGKINQFYIQTYRRSFGHIERSPAYWSWIIKKISFQKLDFLSLNKKDKLIGYLILKGNHIMELAAMPDISYKMILDFLWRHLFIEKENDEVLLHIPSRHPLLDEDLQTDISLQNRECFYGGHIFKILNRNHVTTLFKGRLSTFFLQRGIQSCSFEKCGIDFQWNKPRLSVKIPSASALNYGQTLILLGVDSIYQSYHDDRLPPPLPLTISSLDEF